MSPELLTPEQAGQMLSMSSHSLAQMRYVGNGPTYVKISAKTVRYRPADLEAWIQAHTRTRTRAIQ